VMVAASVLCADTDEEADHLAGPSRLSMLQLRRGTPSPVVSPEEAADYPYSPAERAMVEAATADHAVGGPETVHRRLVALVERTGADELMVSTRAHSLETRARSLTLVAERWGPAGSA